ncbi:uncharacterized protein LOC125038636 [Penaeus chinensis]|uniref:uncharacterized protein LOC125038636 n=1 Tax=Penaeus chinensis TaxID=139456 RepID=UPI001FB79E98|nr:uncharacterized protein LOC125038636 [Penaeus chinensis]
MVFYNEASGLVQCTTMWSIVYLPGVNPDYSSVMAACAEEGAEGEQTEGPSLNMTDLPPVTQTRFTAVRDPTLVLEEEEPYFDMSMSPTQTAYLGKTATLTCLVHAAKNDKSFVNRVQAPASTWLVFLTPSRPPPQVSWIRGRDLRILTVGGYTYTTDLRFEAFHQPHSTEWTLRIKSVQLRDQGGYECQIATKPIRTYHVFLKVEEPSVEVVGAPDIYVNRASMINLTCVVYHAPYPPEDIIWYHGNQTISYTSPRGGVSVVEERGETTTSILLLQKARASDSGTFICQPENMDAAQVTLHVLDGEHPAAMQTNSSCQSTPGLSALVMVAVMTTIARPSSQNWSEVQARFKAKSPWCARAAFGLLTGRSDMSAWQESHADEAPKAPEG